MSSWTCLAHESHSKTSLGKLFITTLKPVISPIDKFMFCFTVLEEVWTRFTGKLASIRFMNNFKTKKLCFTYRLCFHTIETTINSWNANVTLATTLLLSFFKKTTHHSLQIWLHPISYTALLLCKSFSTKLSLNIDSACPSRLAKTCRILARPFLTTVFTIWIRISKNGSWPRWSMPSWHVTKGKNLKN